jgi:hypothetical protein
MHQKFSRGTTVQPQQDSPDDDPDNTRHRVFLEAAGSSNPTGDSCDDKPVDSDAAAVGRRQEAGLSRSGQGRMQR